MATYILRRILFMISAVFIISVLIFVVIELPPGDYVSRYVILQEQRGEPVDQETIENLRRLCRVDKPAFVRYFIWIGRFLGGDLGFSLEYREPVADVLRTPFCLTVTVTLMAMLFTLLLAFPIGVYSAIRRHSIGDYFWSALGLLGLSIPSFLAALVILFVSTKYLNIGLGGLFSRPFEKAPWSFLKLLDLLKHVWIPVIMVGTATTAGLIRTFRARLVAELKQPYVELARLKGMKETRLIIRYPLRIAINPLVSSIGWILPALASGTLITSVVLGLPTAGPIYLQALRAQDMPLVGAFILLVSMLVVAGALVSEIVLALIDPRFRGE